MYQVNIGLLDHIAVLDGVQLSYKSVDVVVYWLIVIQLSIYSTILSVFSYLFTVFVRLKINKVTFKFNQYFMEKCTRFLN